MQAATAHHNSSSNPRHSKATKSHLWENTLDSLAPVSAYQEAPHDRSRSFDSLLISPCVSRTTSRASRASSGAPQPPREDEDAAFEYRLPKGGMFEWVSCPHYLGEVTIYAGFMVMHGGHGLSSFVFLWVVRSWFPASLVYRLRT